jgi:hypothetical protein
MRRTRLLPIAAALAMAAGLACGCATTIVAPLESPPAATSASGAVQRFAWGFNHKDVDVVRGLLTDDFGFVTAGSDSAGNPSRLPRDRPWFLVALAALADSSSTVSLAVDRVLAAFPDARSGKDPRVHKQVRSSVDVSVRFRDVSGNVEVTGNLLFFLTRGDSASIPAEQRARGVKPDSTRWWVDRLEDEGWRWL